MVLNFLNLYLLQKGMLGWINVGNTYGFVQLWGMLQFDGLDLSDNIFFEVLITSLDMVIELLERLLHIDVEFGNLNIRVIFLAAVWEFAHIIDNR